MGIDAGRMPFCVQHHPILVVLWITGLEISLWKKQSNGSFIQDHILNVHRFGRSHYFGCRDQIFRCHDIGSGISQHVGPFYTVPLCKKRILLLQKIDFQKKELVLN